MLVCVLANDTCIHTMVTENKRFAEDTRLHMNIRLTQTNRVSIVVHKSKNSNNNRQTDNSGSLLTTLLCAVQPFPLITCRSQIANNFEQIYTCIVYPIAN